MSRLSDDLREMGYVPTGEESPVAENGILWSNSHELVCDETGIVIDGNHYPDSSEREGVETRNGRVVYRYRNSKRVKFIGGHASNYEWGESDDGFTY